MGAKSDRSVVIVIRNGKLLMERVFYENHEFFTIPGGGIDEGETPEEAAIRELKEECGLDGEIVRPLSVSYAEDGRVIHSFEVKVPDNQQAVTGYDPEEAGSENPPLREVLWLGLNEISERDRAFLWSYGLISVHGFYDELRRWGNQISYPSVDGETQA